VSDLELVNLRKAVVPEGFVLFVDELGTYDTAAERLQRLGYTQLDRLDTPEFPGNFVVRAR
jgi:hypothetical protein